MRNKLWTSVAAALVAAISLSACTTSNRITESTGEYVDDATVTSKVKAALLSDQGLKSFQIGVETYKDVVQLSEFVNSEQMKSHAGDVTAGVAGVRSVRNNLVVK